MDEEIQLLHERFCIISTFSSSIVQYKYETVGLIQQLQVAFQTQEWKCDFEKFASESLGTNHDSDESLISFHLNMNRIFGQLCHKC